MTKKIILTISILTIAILALSLFVGCESYKNQKFAMDNADVSTSNGGSVVYHGDYIYFINGYSDIVDEYKSNWFGNVTKGAIMRIKRGDVDMNNVEIIVPKAVYSTASDTGFSIYGDYLYYVSSSTDESRDGTVNTSTLVFMRTRLDGQDTKVILEIENGLSTQYKYTPDGLLYVSDGNVYFKSTQGKIKTKDAGKLVAEEIATVYFPVSLTYKKGETQLADYFFYTKSSSITGDYTNELHVSSADGSFNKTLIDRTTFTANPDQDVKNAFNVQVVANKDLGNALTIVYTKSYYASTDSTSTSSGTYSYTFKSTSFDFDKANEKKVDPTSLSSLTIVDENTILSTSGTLTSYTYDADSEYYVKKVYSTDYAKIDSATVVGVNNGYLYYISSNVFKRVKLDMSENVQSIGTDKVHTKFVAPELIVDGENVYIYYFNDSHTQYLYRIDLGSYNASSTEVTDILFGVKTDADIKAEADAESE